MKKVVPGATGETNTIDFLGDNLDQGSPVERHDPIPDDKLAIFEVPRQRVRWNGERPTRRGGGRP